MTDQIARLGLEVDSDGFVRARRELGNFSTSARKAERDTERLKRKARESGRAIGQAMGVAATAVAALTANGIRLAATFESELTRMNTLVGVSRDEIDLYRDSILDLSARSGRSANELARAMFAVTSAGARGTAALDLLDNAARASAIGLGDTRDIALAAGAAVTAYGEENLNAAQAVEIMVGTIEQGNLEASQLAGVLGRVLGLAAQAGVSFQDAGAFIASFTRQGVDAAQAVTGLRGALQILVRNPPEQARQALDDLGLSVEQLRDNVRDQGFITAFQDLVDRADAAGISMGQIIPEVEGLSGVLSVFASQGEDAADIATKVGDAVGTLDQRFEQALQNDPALAFSLVREQFNLMQTEIGLALLPSIMGLITAMRGTGEEAGPLANALASLAQVILGIAQGAIFAAGTINEFGKQIGAAAAFLSQNARALIDNADPRRLFEVGGGFKFLRDQWNSMVSISGAVDEAVTEDAEQMWTAYNDALINIGEASDKIGESIENMADRGGAGADDLADQIRSSMQAMREGMEGLTPQINRTSDELDELLSKEEQYRRENEELAAQLQGTAAEAWLEYERAKAQAWADNDAMAISFETLQERLRLLEEQARQTAESFRSDLLGAFQQMTGVDLENLAGTLFGGGGSSGGGLDLGFIGSIGNNFAQSIINGQGVRDSITSAFTSFGGQQMSSAAQGFFETATTDGIAAAFESSKTLGGMVGGFSTAIGQALEGNYVQAAFTAAGTAIAGPIGGIVGSLIGSLFGGDSVPKFQVRGDQATRAIDEGTDTTITTALGRLDFAFREIEAEGERQVIDGFTRIDSNIAAAVRDQSVLTAMSAAVRDFAVSSRSDGEDLENLLRMRLSAALEALPRVLSDVITETNINIDEQIAALNDIFAINRDLQAGGGLGLSGAAEGAQGLNSALTVTVELVNELRIGSETLADTYQRLVGVTQALDRVSALMGATFGDTREAAIRFGAELVSFFGDNAAELSRSLDTLLSGLYSDAELAAADIETATASATMMLTELLSGIDGIDFTEGLLTVEGFRQLFESLTSDGTLTPAQLALLIQAGNEIVGLAEDEQALADARREAAEAVQEQIDATNDFRNSLNDQLFAEVASRFRNAVRDVYQDTDELIAQSVELGQAEQFIGRIRAIEAARLNRLAGEITASLRSSVELLWGSGAQTQASNAISSINQISQANQSRYEEELRYLEQLRGFRDNFLTSDLSPLNPQDRLNEARRQLLEALSAAEGGDIDALGQVQGLADQFIRLFSAATGGVGEFPPEIMALLDRIDDLGNRDPVSLPPSERPPNALEVSSGFNSVTNELTELQRQLAIGDVVDQLGLLSQITGRSPSELANELGIPLNEVVQAITGELPGLTGDALSVFFDDLITSTNESLNELAVLEDMAISRNDLLTQIRDILAQPDLPPQFTGPSDGPIGQLDPILPDPDPGPQPPTNPLPDPGPNPTPPTNPITPPGGPEPGPPGIGPDPIIAPLGGGITNGFVPPALASDAAPSSDRMVVNMLKRIESELAVANRDRRQYSNDLVTATQSVGSEFRKREQRRETSSFGSLRSRGSC